MRLPPQYQVCDLLRLIGQFHFPKQFNHPITVLGTSGSVPVFHDPGFIRPFVDVIPAYLPLLFTMPFSLHCRYSGRVIAKPEVSRNDFPQGLEPGRFGRLFGTTEELAEKCTFGPRN